MARFIVRRLSGVLIVVFLVSVIAFVFFQLLPGDPAQAQLGLFADETTLERLRVKMGLDKPMPIQYWRWLTRAVAGDFGTSIVTRGPTITLVIKHLGPSLLLAGLTIGLSLPLGIGLGVTASAHPNSPVDRLVGLITIAGISLPNFWLAILLILVFSLTLRWLPSGGYVPPSEDLLGFLRAMALPTLTQVVVLSAVLARVTRGSMIDTLFEDFILTARAKGIPEKYILYQHALKNALVPVVSVVGLQIGALIGGAIITEYIFSIPGLGLLLINSIYRQDLPVVQAIALVTASAFVLANLGVDVVYAILNPKIRYG